MEPTQPGAYGRLIARYEALYEREKITAQQLDFIKSSHTIEDVLKRAETSMVVNEVKRSDPAIKIAMVGLEKLERVSTSLHIMIQTGSDLHGGLPIDVWAEGLAR